MGTIPDSSVVKKCLRLLNLQNYQHPYADHGSQKMLTGPTIMLVVEAILHKRESLWDIGENLYSKDSIKECVSLDGIDPSTIHRKLEKQPTNLLQDVESTLFAKIHNQNKTKKAILNIVPVKKAELYRTK